MQRVVPAGMLRHIHFVSESERQPTQPCTKAHGTHKAMYTSDKSDKSDKSDIPRPAVSALHKE